MNKTIATVYVKESEIIIKDLYFDNIRYKNNIEELSYLLLLYLSEYEYDKIKNGDFPLLELELIYRVDKEKNIIRDLNLKCLAEKINTDEELQLSLKYLFSELYLLIMKIDEIKRNDLCPCGSNKKYKNCCFKNN